LIISPYSTTWFYEDLAAENGDYDTLQTHARLFTVPEMQHCTDGTGPNTFDTLSAIENWVEKGVAPEAIPATHSTNDTVERTMPLCKFPEKARYMGSGDRTPARGHARRKISPCFSADGPNGVAAGANAVAPARVRAPAKLASKGEN
jgi:feruloyl esterase